MTVSFAVFPYRPNEATSRPSLRPALEPLLAAGTEPVEVRAAHLGAVAVEVDANFPPPAAAGAVRRDIRERRECRSGDGRLVQRAS
jgi:hypothetical protein